MKHIFWLLVLVSVAVSTQAQVSAGGTPASFGKVYIGDDMPVATMPPVDVATLMAEDETRNVKGNAFRFGKAMDVDFNLANSGQWHTLKNGDRIWRMGIKSSGAYSINLIYSQFYMPQGASMFVYSADKSMVLGAFTPFNNKDHGKFSTDVVKGDHTIIEYYEPAAVRGQGRIAVNKVIHAYYNIFFREEGDGRSFGQSGSCNNNVVCPISAGWENQVNSSLMYLSGTNDEICSGAMVNNVRGDGTPYFLSANHCYSGDYATWIFRFNYQSPTCTPNQNGPLTQTVSGSILRARSANSDFALYELSTTPPLSYNVYYAGWSNVNTAPTSSVGIHHPALDVKKFSVDNDPATASTFGGAPANSHWEVGDWDSGTTEGGSSGSPLFDQNKRVVGQLHGGGAACGNSLEDSYGKFAISWNGSSASNRLKDWLDPDNTGATVLDGATFNVPTTTRDVQLTDIAGIDAYSCNGTVSATLRFLNRGGDALTSFTYRYRANPGPWDTLTWTGNIAFGNAGSIALPTTTLPAGAYTMEAEVLLVNGQTDLDNSNDNADFAFTVVAGRSITVGLRTDFYGGETTLRIVNNNGLVVWEETGFSSNTNYTLNPCLAVGCYTFTILDSEGDGICCSYGNGSYTVTNADGVQVVQGGNFNSSQSTNFCITSLGPLVAAASVSSDTTCVGAPVTYTNTSTGIVTTTAWQFPGGSPSIATTANPTVTYGAAGTYNATLVVTGAGGADTITLAVVVRDVPTLSVSRTNTSTAGAVDGEATATATGVAPLTYVWSNGGTTATITGLAAGTYTVTVTDAAGCSVSQAVTIASGLVGIDGLEASLGVQLFPNPATERITLTLTKPTEGLLQVYDNLGRIVYQTATLDASNNITVATWAKGVYYLRLTVPQGMVVKKFVVGM